MSKELDKHFPKEDTQMAKNLKKGCSTSLVIREMKSTSTTKYHFIPTIIKTDNIKCYLGCGDESPHRLLVGMQNVVAMLNMSWGAPQKVKHRVTL